jgi:DNA-binding NarL/FixJ family response regulator
MALDCLIAAHAAALVVRYLPGDCRPSEAEVAAAIRSAIAAHHGIDRYVGEVPIAYREHPATAAPPMRWARQTIEATYSAAGGQALGHRVTEDRGVAMSMATAADHAPMLATPGLPAEAPPGQAKLSARERELVTPVAQGRTNAQIAAQLYISVRTVGSHLDRIRDKTSCRHRADLTRLALTTGAATPCPSHAAPTDSQRLRRRSWAVAGPQREWVGTPEQPRRARCCLHCTPQRPCHAPGPCD